MIVGDTPPPYTGANVLLRQLLNSDLKRRFDFVLLDISDRRPNDTRGRFDLTNVLLALCHSALLGVMVAFRRPDVVYLPLSQGLWGFFRDAVFINLAWLTRRKILVHFHGSDFDKFYQSSMKAVQLLIRLSLRHIDLLIVLAENLKSVFDGLVDQEKIRVVYNGIDSRLFESNKRNPDTGNRTVKVLYLSKKSYAKGVYDFLRTIPLVIHKEKDVKFILAGDSVAFEEFPWHSGHICHTEKEITGLIRENGLTDVMEIRGEVTGSDKRKIFAESDIFVMPSYSEGMPLVILEAMAAGLPIVATRVGALPEILEEGRNGFLVEVGDYGALARRIIELVKNSDLRKKIGRGNSRVVKETFGGERYVEGIEQVCLEVFHGIRA